MARDEWRLTADVVIPYGTPGVHYLLHVRSYESGDGSAPVVIVGEFGDHVGPSLTNTVAEAAADVQAAVYPDGRSFRFVQMRYPGDHNHTDPVEFNEVSFARRKRLGRLRRWFERTLNTRSNRWLLTQTVIDEDGSTRYTMPSLPHTEQFWEFDGPSWSPDLPLRWPAGERSALVNDLCRVHLIRPACVQLPDEFLDLPIEVWPEQLYTPALIGGPEAEQIANERRAACNRRYEAESSVMDAFGNPPPGAITETGSTPNSRE